MMGADELDPGELAAFRKRLVARRTELDDAVRTGAARTAPVALDQQSVRRLSRMDALQQQAMAEERRRRDELVRIEATLRRIDAGDYGWCAACG